VSWGASESGVGRAPAGRPVLTVVFTDIVGSTALIERLGDDRWVEVLSAHDDAVRSALRTHGGEEVKTTGDGFLAVFGDAAGDGDGGATVHVLDRTRRRATDAPGRTR